MKFLKAYWLLVLAFIIAIVSAYFYYDLTMQLAEKEAIIERLNATE